eukprot:CAMPEP_0202881470 /NCGR_PEP_ID=MMETSP1391-20130828/36590_1 /ASSEMBLY_ACC=CAM_ASM_000867 /TAXON_ID=1034604 /ORGANISM="Chlamydomonas leiostraca, Strain SAG 11-49" /LENGTH=97 /DNA_ID=CAMNT_0049564167 /DNA_START=80 /DNA_END=369 /DNA_ORIENTATION=+
MALQGSSIRPAKAHRGRCACGHTAAGAHSRTMQPPQPQVQTAAAAHSRPMLHPNVAVARSTCRPCSAAPPAAAAAASRAAAGTWFGSKAPSTSPPSR